MPTAKSSVNTKLRKKLNVANGIFKDDKRSVETLDSEGDRARKSKKTQRREIEANRVSHSSNVTSKKGSRVKRTVKSNAVGDVYEGVGDGKSGISGGKRKRVYAIPDMGKEGSLKDKVGSSSKVDLKTERKFSDSRDSLKNSLSREGRRSKNSEVPNKKNYGMEVKEIKKAKTVKVDGLGKEESNQRKSNVKKPLNQNENKQRAESLSRPSRKKVHEKKNSGGDSDERPKKKKRVIRIDPHDTSNKRLDDGLLNKDNNKEKQDYSAKEKTVEMSKNAQFRAIRPSPSILSFVEDNLLGRRRDIQIRRAGYNIELSAPLDNIPFSSSSERERIEEPVFRNKLEFFAAAEISSSFPLEDLPEIAFAGRSNVGKSSLLNALTRQWGVVRTSDKPGLTQSINFFNLGSKMCLVDLPGYGFAYAKEEVKEAWEELVKEYVSTRLGLKRVCLLIDTKWGMKQRDQELVDLMERSQTKYQIILTKTDTVFPIDVARRAMQIEENLKAHKSVVQPVMMVSSKSGAGIRSLRTAFTKIARFVKP